MAVATAPVALLVVTSPEYVPWLKLPLFDALCVALWATFILHRFFLGPLLRRIVLLVLVISNLLTTYLLLGGSPLVYSLALSVVFAVVVSLVRNAVGRIYQWAVRKNPLA